MKRIGFVIYAFLAAGVAFADDTEKNVVDETLAKSQLATRGVTPQPRSVVYSGRFYRPAGDPVIAYERDAKVPAEGYRLQVGADGVRIASSDDAGRFYALKTLDQLKTSDGWRGATVEDSPAHPYRAVLVDDARVNYGKAGVKKIIDEMSAVKLNVFHWHFIEPEAWRFEISGYPKLTEGLKRENRYSADDVREVVAYAAARHVKVVPEIEMPGHNAVTRFYPELLCEGAKRGGVCPSNPKTVAFFKAAIDAACAVFPSEMIHLGGDEVDYRNWKKCPRCQAKIKELGLGGEADLQAWFMNEMAACVTAHGKTPMCWSDALLTLQDGMKQNAKGYWTGYGVRKTLSKDFVITAWYGDWECAGGCGAVSANLGYKTVQYPGNHCYFDHAQLLKDDPNDYGKSRCRVTLMDAYDWSPLTDVKPACRKNILGVGCANWGEHATDLKALEWKLWPRGYATAEAGWCDAPKRDWKNFELRAKRLAEIVRGCGVNAAFGETIDKEERKWCAKRSLAGLVE